MGLSFQDKTSLDQLYDALLDSRRRIPVLVPSFNNPTYLRQFLSQIHVRKNLHPIVVDNSSTYPKMLELLSDLDGWGINLVRFNRNLGPHFLRDHSEFLELMPRYFCLSDPDLQLNSKLPQDFSSTLMSISEEFSVPKVGFALDIGDSADFRDHKFKVGKKNYKIYDWEKKFWKSQLMGKPEITMFRADIDTTFALYNKNFFSRNDFYSAVRVAGDFTAKHLPWYSDSIVPTEEAVYYSTTALFSTYSASSVNLEGD